MRMDVNFSPRLYDWPKKISSPLRGESRATRRGGIGMGVGVSLRSYPIPTLTLPLKGREFARDVDPVLLWPAALLLVALLTCTLPARAADGYIPTPYVPSTVIAVDEMLRVADVR